MEVNQQNGGVVPVPRICDEQQPRSFHDLTVARATVKCDGFPTLRIGLPEDILDLLASFERQLRAIFNTGLETESGVDGQDGGQAGMGKTVIVVSHGYRTRQNIKDLRYCSVIDNSRLLIPNTFFA
jgi:hypothetical protein